MTTDGEGFDLLPGQHWFPISSADPRGMALYLRHYSAKPHPNGRSSRHFVSGGYRMVLMTADARALWVWQWMPGEYRKDDLEGVYCAIFRNEGPVQSSVLVREAEELAWQRWPGAQLFTFVDPRKVASPVAGWCFIRCRWKRRGTTARGLFVFVKQAPQAQRDMVCVRCGGATPRPSRVCWECREVKERHADA